jgi:uncharacterized protein YktB (UPF0637 family)
VTFKNDRYQQIEKFEELLVRTGLDRTKFPNRCANINIDTLKKLLPEAVQKTKDYMSKERKDFESIINKKLNDQLTALDRLKKKQHEQLELLYSETRQLSKKEQEKREIDRIFDEFINWVEDTMTTEDNPFIQVIAVLKGAE